MLTMKKIFLLFTIFIIALSASAQTGTWSGKLDVQGAEIRLVFHLDDENPVMDSPDQGVKGVPIQIERDEIFGLKIKIPSIGATYEGSWMVNKILGTFTQWGRQFPLTLLQGEMKLNRPQTPKAPFPYETEEVSFCNGDAVLKGTLTLPHGYTQSTPVLIMVTGSGLQNRDEEIFEHKPFAVIADALARGGVATLRYDDRGFGESTGDIVNCTTEDLKNDALSGISMLRKRFDNVGVIGHSEGGSIAIILAAEQQADFIISLAGCVVSGKEALMWQNERALTEAGIPASTVQAYCKLIGEAFDATIAGDPIPKAGDSLPMALAQNYAAAVQQLRTPYMRYFLKMDMRPLLGKITCPVFALNGTKDTQVECVSNLNALQNGLTGNSLNSIEAVEGVNHLFQHCATGVATEYGKIEETFAPEVLEKIVAWVKALQLR